MYTDKQLENVIQFLDAKYLLGEIEPHELVVTLLSMVKAEKINESQAAHVLMRIFMDNPEAVKKALDKAKIVADDKTLDEIVKKVNDKK